MYQEFFKKIISILFIMTTKDESQRKQNCMIKEKYV